VLKYFSYKIIFIVLAIPLVIVSWSHPYGWIWMILFALLFILGIVFGSINVGSGFYLDVICKGLHDKNAIALSFDDGPDETQTEKILNILKEHGIKACFFCIGKNALKNENIIKRINDEGHIIGNHSFSHAFWFDFFPLKKMKKDITEANKTINKMTGKNMRFFRPPYGVTTPVLAKAVKRTGMIPIGWSLRTLDTVSSGNIEKVMKRLGKAKPGDIILFHDHVISLPEMLETFIMQMKEKKIEFVRLDDLINIKAYYE
jgi:peptidoglycan-N-acetylglucosamine deacetylase